MNELLPNLTFLIYVFNVIAAFNSIAIIYLFIRYYQSYSPATSFLGLYMFSMFVVNLMIFLIYSGYIIYVPWLYRLPSPLYYAMFPAAYFYVKMTLADQEKLKKKEYLHFLPAAIHFLEMMPYHLRGNEYKIRHIIESAQRPLSAYLHDEGILPPYFHNILRAIQGIIYGVLMLGLVSKVIKHRQKLIRNFQGMKNWLLVFSTVVLTFALSILVAFIGQWANAEFRSLNLAFWAALSLGITSIAMITNPMLLYGMPRLSRALGRREQDSLVTGSARSEPGKQEVQVHRRNQDLALTPDADVPKWVEKYTSIINEFKKTSRSYLSKRYSIREMSAELSIPQHHLSYLLNNVYQIRFNDFINQLRIEYLSRMVVENGLLKEMTLEGMAKEAGFSSRVTFIRAVQRITGENPREYFQNILSNKPSS